MKLLAIVCYLCCAFGLSRGDWSMCKEAAETDFDRLSAIKWNMALRLGKGVFPCEIWQFGEHETISSISSARNVSNFTATVDFSVNDIRTYAHAPTVKTPEPEEQAALIEIVESTMFLCIITDYDHHVIVVLHDGSDNLQGIYVLLKTDSITAEDFLSIYNGSVASDLFPKRPYTITTCPAKKH